MKQKQLRAVLLFLTLSLSLSALAQKDTVVTDTFPKTKKLSYKVAYFGNSLWYPGLSCGAEYVLGQKRKIRVIKTRKGDVTKTKTRQLIFNAVLGGYWQPGSYTGLFTSYGLIYRRTFNRKFQYNVGINPLSYYRSFLPETYEVADNSVTKVVLPGRSSYAPSIFFGIGKNREGKTLNAWFLNLNLTTLIPYGLGAVPLVSIEYGFRIGKNKDK